MAATTHRRLVLTAMLAACLLWSAVALLYAARWKAVTRASVPERALFIYGELRIGVDTSYPPFATTTADGLAGIEIDIGRALAEQLDVPVRFAALGFDGMYDALQTDQVDILISTLRPDPTRLNAVRYTGAYFDNGLTLVSRADAVIASMESLPGHRLGLELGSGADFEARRWLRRVLPFEVLPYELPAYALDAARLGEADAALVEAVDARLYLQEHADWDAAVHPITRAPYVIAARADRGPTADAVESALEGLRADGTLDAIINRWFARSR